MSESREGFEAIAKVAKRQGVRTECMRRRLFKLAAKIAKEHKHEAPLLVRFGSRGWYLDRSVAYRHARGLVADGGESTVKRLFESFETFRDQVTQEMRAIREDMNAVRQLVGLE